MSTAAQGLRARPQTDGQYMSAEETFQDSFLDFTCPHCGDPVSFPQDHAGSVQACPSCNKALLVPTESGGTGGKIPVPINTDRLTLRRLESRDWKDLLELISDEELFRYTDWVPMEEEGVLRWLESDQHVQLTSADQTFYLGIQLNEADRLIGYLGLNFIDPHRWQASFRIFVGRTWQRKGFGLEAADALLGFCFAGIKLHRVAVSCDTRNTAAVKLLEKLGLRREGEFLKDHWHRGEWVNTAYYALLDEECAPDAPDA